MMVVGGGSLGENIEVDVGRMGQPCLPDSESVSTGPYLLDNTIRIIRNASVHVIE